MPSASRPGPVLGFRLAPPDLPGHVAGWAIIEHEPNILVLHAESRLMVARMVVDASDSHTTLTTLLLYKRPATRRVWAMAGIAHRALTDRAELADLGKHREGVVPGVGPPRRQRLGRRWHPRRNGSPLCGRGE
jgi:hypothetical protein